MRYETPPGGQVGFKYTDRETKSYMLSGRQNVAIRQLENKKTLKFKQKFWEHITSQMTFAGFYSNSSKTRPVFPLKAPLF